MSFNKIIIIGNLGRDPELRYTPQGVAVCSFNVATNEKRRDKSGEKQDITTWFKVTLWRERAETAAKYLTKGSTVYIEGRLKIEEWTDRDDNNRYTLDVQGTDMQFINTNNGGGAEYTGEAHATPAPATAAAAAPAGTPPPATTPPEDDIPF
jgi:single-strand DNA-binding protein